MSEQPFDDVRAVVAALPGPDEAALAAARERQRRAGSAAALGRLGEIALWLAAWSGRSPVAVARPQVAVFAGAHGLAVHGVDGRRRDYAAAMVEHCAAGGAAVSQICMAGDIGLKVYDLALDVPTADITREDALDERACAATIAFGMEAVAGGMDLLAVGDIGVGGSVAAIAVLAAIHGGDWSAREEGEDAVIASRRAEVVQQALGRHRDALGDPLAILRRLGGREIAGIVGAIVAARVQKVPVILDGHAALAAASVLRALDPGSVAHCTVACVAGSALLIDAAQRLGMSPLLGLDTRLDAAAAGAVAIGLVRTAATLNSGMRPLPEA